MVNSTVLQNDGRMVFANEKMGVRRATLARIAGELLEIERSASIAGRTENAAKARECYRRIAKSSHDVRGLVSAIVANGGDRG